MISRKKTRNALIAAFVFLTINTRPAVFGHLFNELFLLLPMAGLVAVYIALEYPIVISRSKIVLLGVTAAYLGWIFFQILILDPENLYTGLIIVVTIPTVVIGCTLLTTNSDAELVLRTIVAVVALLSISQLVTYSLMLFGFEGKILITEEYMFKENVPFRWYFPYTFTYHHIKIAGHRIERATGLFREPGLYQVFIVISYFALDFIRVRHECLLRGLFIFSLLTTFSTAGYVVFIGCLIYKNLLIRRDRRLLRLVLLVVLVGLLWAFISIPGFGLRDKMSRNESRILSLFVSWQLLLQEPILGYSVTSVEEGVLGEMLGVNLLTSLHKLGFVGLGLYCGLVLYAMYRHYTLQTLVLLLPVLVTLLISQPLYAKAFTFAMLFLFTRNLRPLGNVDAKEDFRRQRGSQC